MQAEALIRLRVPAELKARWVRESRVAGMRLTDWIVSKVEAQPMKKTTPISIPLGMTFADLRLERDSKTGDVSFDTSVIERIEQESGLPAGFFMGQHEDALAALITTWYSAHRAAGGDADPVAEDLLAEVLAEDAAGQPYSHAPGRA
jgi:hypothetical protein